MMLATANHPRSGNTSPSRARVTAIDAVAFAQRSSYPHLSTLPAGDVSTINVSCDTYVYKGAIGTSRRSCETRRSDGPVAREFGAAGMPAGIGDRSNE